LIITPGIRPAGADKGDQKRIFTPEKALKAGSDYIVVDVPSHKLSNPRESCSPDLGAMASARVIIANPLKIKHL